MGFCGCLDFLWICVTLGLALHPAADCGRLIADFLRMPCRREQRARGKEKKKNFVVDKAVEDESVGVEPCQSAS